MYLHLGNDIVVRKREVLGIFDLDITSQSVRTRAYLAAAEELGDVHLKALVLEGIRRSGPERPREAPEEDDPH